MALLVCLQVTCRPPLRRLRPPPHPPELPPETGKCVQRSPVTGTDVSEARRLLVDALLGRTSVRYGLGLKSRTAQELGSAQGPGGSCNASRKVCQEPQANISLLLPDEEDGLELCGGMQQSLQGCQTSLCRGDEGCLLPGVLPSDPESQLPETGWQSPHQQRRAGDSGPALEAHGVWGRPSPELRGLCSPRGVSGCPGLPSSSGAPQRSLGPLLLSDFSQGRSQTPSVSPRPRKEVARLRVAAAPPARATPGLRLPWPRLQVADGLWAPFPLSCSTTFPFCFEKRLRASAQGLPLGEGQVPAAG
ncbi:uncharacterized protein LOC113488150 [Athene cunicularia]|uniref:uncharacterized protein LOC113488150 n=1 Tax=Athene cunicularia TaxID=194338 RepID=UPI000EF7163C|nr:uncharacterized protein LOC113488150 [Athene cunicularia]